MDGSPKTVHSLDMNPTLGAVNKLDPNHLLKRLISAGSPPTMKTSLGPRFPQSVKQLVTWFLDTGDLFDEKALTVAAEEILAENGRMSDLELQNAILARYAQKIYAVLQPPALKISPLDPVNSMHVRKYKFAPLVDPSEIRLLRFNQFLTLGEQIHISCEIVHANLDDMPEYTAISSYRRGQVPHGDQESHRGPLPFSGADTPTDVGNRTRLLWMDQLCINQYDAEERAKQVAMMGRIYTEARATKLWLGEEDETSEQAFSLIRCFEYIESKVSWPALVGLKSLNEEEMRQKFLGFFPQAVGKIPPREDLRWRKLFEFLARPWFSRLWVFQEAILSSSNAVGSVVCGQSSCTFFHLYLARSLLFVDWEVSSLPAGFEMVTRLMQFYVYRNLEIIPPICFTVWQIGKLLRSQDPRDRIYGLLSVQNPKKDIRFPIDYTKSVEDVYIDFARRCIGQDQCLRIMELLEESRPRNLPALPSWVPDWTTETLIQPIDATNLGHENIPRFKASTGYPHVNVQAESLSKQTLVVKGKIIDYVVAEVEHDFQIGHPIDTRLYFSINFRVLLWVKFIVDGIKRGLIKEGTEEQLQAAVIRTIMADGYNDMLFAQKIPDELSSLPNEEAVAIFNELERLWELLVAELPDDGAHTDLHQRIWTTTEVCRGRRLAVLQDHWIMLGPTQARRGDCIAILHGSHVAWVLRKQDAEDTFEVIGQCFVDGAMYGEVVDWAEDEADTLLLV